MSLKKMPPKVFGDVVLGDSRDKATLPTQVKFDYIVTSPPYLGMDTYVPDQWLRQWFLGGKDDVEYSREHQVGRSCVEAFSCELAKVWRNVAAACRPGAAMASDSAAYQASRRIVRQSFWRRSQHRARPGEGKRPGALVTPRMGTDRQSSSREQ